MWTGLRYIFGNIKRKMVFFKLKLCKWHWVKVLSPSISTCYFSKNTNLLNPLHPIRSCISMNLSNINFAYTKMFEEILRSLESCNQSGKGCWETIFDWKLNEIVSVNERVNPKVNLFGLERNPTREGDLWNHLDGKHK